MKINRIGFGYTKNLGNYENCKIWLEAELEDWEDALESLNILRTQVAKELQLPEKWHDLKGELATKMSFLKSLTSQIEDKKVALAQSQEAWDNFAEFLTAHGVDPVTLTIDNFAATRADHSPAKSENVPIAKYVADDSAELGFGELDTSDDDDDAYWNQDDEDDDDDY